MKINHPAFNHDASMAMVTIHRWSDIKKGLLELRRITKKPVLILTLDPNSLEELWKAH